VEEYSIQEILSWPKVELHVHLDTSLSFETVSLLNKGISSQAYLNRYVLPGKVRDLHHFLKYVEPGIALLQSKQAIYLAVLQLVKEQSQDGVIYTEIRLAPLLHTRMGLSDFEVCKVVVRAAKDAELETGVIVRLIFCTMRHFSPEESMRTVNLALDFRYDGVVGFDIAGDEAGYSLNNHIEAFQKAFEQKLPSTAHAGEACGPDSIIQTLDLLKVNRIGHGVRALENKYCMQRLLKDKIHLEVCPLSNILINVFSDISVHPIHQLYSFGLNLGVNTDGWGLFQNSLSGEYEQLIRTFRWQKDDLQTVNKNSLDAAFCDDITKSKLRLQFT